MTSKTGQQMMWLSLLGCFRKWSLGCVCVCVWKSIICVFVTPWTVVHGILQARIPEWVAVPFSRGSSQPRDQTQVSHSAGGFLTTWATREVPWYRSSFSRTFLDKVLSDHTSGPIYNYSTILNTKVEFKVCDSTRKRKSLYIFF